MYNDHNSNNTYDDNEYVDYSKNNFPRKSNMDKILVIILLLIIAGLVYIMFFKDRNSKDKDNIVQLTSISFPKDNLSLKVGSSFDLSNHIMLNPPDATIEKITYYNGNSSILSISDKGMIQALSNGRDEITITVNGGIEKKISVTVSDNGLNSFVDEITSLSFATSNIEIMVGEEKDLEVLPSSVDKSSLTWQSSDENIVTVDDNGKIKGISSGNATIVASSPTGLEARINIQVSKDINNNTVQSIEFNQQEITQNNGKSQLVLKAGEKYTLIPKVVPDTATDKKLTFIASAKGLITLVPSADGTSVTINTTDKTGTVTITVQSSNNVSRDLIVIIEQKTDNTTPSDKKKTTHGSSEKEESSSDKQTGGKKDDSSGNKNDDDYVPPMTGSCEAKIECLDPTYTGKEIPISSIASCEHCSIIDISPRDKIGRPDRDTSYTITAVSLGVCRFFNSNKMSERQTKTCSIRHK